MQALSPIASVDNDMAVSGLPLDAPRVLIADDQPAVLEALRLLLKSKGYSTEAVTSPAAVLDALQSRHFDALLMDLNYARHTTSGEEGLDLMSRIRALDSSLPVIAMTAWGTVELAVEAMHRGVRDFIQKPWDNVRLLDVVHAQIELGRASRKGRRLEKTKRLLQQREFEEAREIQRGLLPKEIPKIPGYDIVCAWHPASAVGGDYFDALKFRDGRFAFCIADVVGNGMPAALLMSNLQAAVRAFASEGVEPGDLCTKINRVICGNTAVGRFITFFYFLLDPARKCLTYTRAGHFLPILLRRDGSLVRLHNGGAVFGVFPEEKYEQGEVELLVGDTLVLFTDGVTEARNSAGEEFGEERLITLLAENRDCSAAQLQRKVLEVVAAFSERDLKDDVTLIVMRL